MGQPLRVGPFHWGDYMARYRVRLLDRDRELVAVLDYISGLGYSRRFGQATPITIRLPRMDPKTKLVEQAHWIELWRGDTRKFVARVSERDLSQDPAIITAMTPEILLSDWHTPRNWLYDGMDGADVLRDLCLKFQSTVFNAVEHWNVCELYQVDLDTQPTRAGDVIIARDDENHHYEHGYVVTPPIDLGNVYRIERIRWAEKAGGTLPDGSPLTQITVQTRTGNTSVPDGSWSAWSSEFSAIESKEAEQKGIVTSSPTARFIQVKVNLYTKDTFTPSEDGGRFGLTPILHGLEVVARYETDIQGLAIPQTAGKQISEMTFNASNHLAAINQVCQRIGWEWYVDDNLTLHAGPELGVYRTDDMLFRHGTNTDIQQLTDDDGELVNVLHCYGEGSGLSQLYVCLRDEESIALYGEREGTFEDTNIEALAELEEAGQSELEKRRNPPQRFEITVIPDYDWPEFGLGDTIRITSPIGIVTTGRILEEQRNIDDGQEVVTLGINSELYDLIDHADEDDRPPEPPSVPVPQLFRAVPGREQIGLLWVGEGDYYVLTHSTDGLNYSVLDNRIVGQTYLHTGLNPGTKHYYKVRAVAGGRSSAFAGPVAATALAISADDGLPPATPSGLTLSAATTVVPPGALQIAVTATWDPNTENDLADYMLRRRKQGDEAWQVVATIPAGNERYIDTGGLLPDTIYEYAIAARDVFGNTSEWSVPVPVSVSSDEVAPGMPTGLVWDFSGRDAVFSWDPCDDVDFRRTVVEIWTGGELQRTDYTAEPHYVYDYDTNRLDNGTAQAEITIKIAHEDIWGNVSPWATAIAKNRAPGMPQGFTMGSTAATIQMDCNPPAISDLAYVECQLALQSDYGDAVTVYVGTAYQGILAPIKGAGINYGRARFMDVFGQVGPWATSSTSANLITREDMQGAIFQIQPSSLPAPSTGILEQLWDADIATGPTFASAPTITFEYPMTWFFDMARFWVDRLCKYYVQAWDGSAWANVAGSATSRLTASGGEWTVQRFDNNKMVATDKLRIVFDRAVKLTELKFWTVTFADEILAQKIQAWQMNVESLYIADFADGPTYIEAIGQAQQTAADAITAAAGAQATADGKVTTYFQLAAPAAEAEGDLWIHTGDGNKLFRWDGTQWVEAQDAGIVAAITAATDAQHTAERKIQTFYQDIAPAAANEGDLWVDTGSHNKLYRWNGAAWVDVSDKSPIDADERPISSINNQITMDSTGLKMRRAGESIDRMHLDARRLGFRDPSTGTPTAGIGYVRDLAQELDPNVPPDQLIGHGLFIAQGEIRASQSVLSESLTEGGTGMTKLADGSVALPKLADTLSVTLPNRFVLHMRQTIDDLNSLTNPGFESGNLQGWAGTGAMYSGDAHTGTYSVYNCNIYQDVAASAGQVWTGQAWLRDTYRQSFVTLQFLNASKTVLATHDSPVVGGGGWHCLYVTAVAPANTAYARLVIKTQNNYYNVRFDDCALACTGIATNYATFLDTTLPAADACEQLRINTSIDNPSGVTVYTRVLVNGTVVLDTTGVTQPVTASVTLDTRGIDGDIRVQVQAKTNSGVATWNQAEVHHNQRLPLRGAPPRYTIVEEAESSCGAPCEASCQTQCQNACEAACQSTCQAACQHACESTCEKTSQGGGCWVEGTPVTVIDGDHIYDIPVEDLEPGMMMPWYDPATDTLQESECLSNQKTYTHTIYVAEVEGGYTLEMTGEQPMDVLRPHYATGETMWHKLPARYIRPGDKLVRPFDGNLHEVLSLESTQRAKTWVYNPRTTSGRYIVHGFADSEKLLT